MIEYLLYLLAVMVLIGFYEYKIFCIKRSVKEKTCDVTVVADCGSITPGDATHINCNTYYKAGDYMYAMYFNPNKCVWKQSANVSNAMMDEKFRKCNTRVSG